MGSVEEIIEYVSKWRSSSTYTTYSDGTLTVRKSWRCYIFQPR